MNDNVHAWNVHTMQEFPGYTLRVREDTKLCDPDVKQYVGYVDVEDDSDDKHVCNVIEWCLSSQRIDIRMTAVLLLVFRIET